MTRIANQACFSARTRSLSAAIVLGACMATANAGRPLATDDAAVADTGGCQFEAWTERDDSSRAWVLAPACGIAKGWEVGGDLTRRRDAGDYSTGVGLAAKWLPLPESLKTPLGPLTLGLKFALGAERARAGSLRVETGTTLGLATLELAETLQIHANLGPVHDRRARSTHTALNVAAAWSPTERTLLFAEVQAVDSAAAGGTVRALGGRWWIQPERLGVDLTAARETGGSNGTRWSVGLGWYRIGL